MFGGIPSGGPLRGSLSLRDAAISGSLAGKFNRLAVDTDAPKRDNPGTPDSRSKEAPKRPKTLEDEARDKMDTVMDQIDQINKTADADVMMEENVIKSDDPSSITDDMIVQSMGNQNRVCLIAGTSARKGVRNDDFSSSNKAVEIRGEFVVPLAPIDKMDIVVPFDAWKGMKLLSPKSSQAERDKHSSIEFNFVVNEDFVERLYDPTPFDPKTWAKNGNTGDPPYTEEEYVKILKEAEDVAKSRGIAERGRKYTLGDIPYSTGPAPVQGDKTAEKHRDDLRRHGLLKFGYNLDSASGGFVSISLTDLEKQDREAGMPIFTKGRFLRMCDYPKMERDENGRPIQEYRDVYDRANKYRMEVGRLWWKLFIDQEDEVQRTIYYLTGVGGERALQEAEGEGLTEEERKAYLPMALKNRTKETGFEDKTPAADEFFRAMENAEKEAREKFLGVTEETKKGDAKNSRADQYKDMDNFLDYNDPMVIAVTELGRKGRLDVGSIIPQYRQVEMVSGLKWVKVEQIYSEYPTDQIVNEKLQDALVIKQRFTEEELRSYGITELHTDNFVKIGRSYFKPTDIQFDETGNEIQPPGRKFKYILAYPKRDENDSAQDGLREIQQIGNYTWPAVKIGRTRAWQNWISGTKSDGGGSLGFSKSIIERNKLVFQVMRSFFEDDVGNDNPWSDEFFPVGLLAGQEDTPETRAQMWLVVEDVFGDICDACPSWAQAYLSVELVDDPELKKEDAESVAALKEELPSADPDSAALIKRKIELLDPGEESARETGSLVWNGYYTTDPDTITKLDAHGNRDTTWAHEQLLRCVTAVRSSERGVGADYRIGPYIDPVRPTKKVVKDGKEKEVDNELPGLRAVDRSEVSIGDAETADYYECWFIERYLGNGIGNVGQLCALQRMDEFVKTATPYYLHAQGRKGKIVQITENASKNDSTVSPLLYVVHTEFIVSHDSESQLQQDIANGVCTQDKKLIVKVPGDNIWPFSFDVPFRYGDQALLKKEISTPNQRYTELLGEYPGDIALSDYKWYGPEKLLRDRGLLTTNDDMLKALRSKIETKGGLVFFKWNYDTGGGKLDSNTGVRSARNPDYLYTQELDPKNPGRICRDKETALKLIGGYLKMTYYIPRVKYSSVTTPSNIVYRALDEETGAQPSYKSTDKQKAAADKLVKEGVKLLAS